MTTGVEVLANDGATYINAVGGETSLSFDFLIYFATHIKIVRTRAGVQATGVLNTDFSVPPGSLSQELGGSVNLIGTWTPAQAGDKYALLLNVPAERLTDFNDAGDFFADALNLDLDLGVQRDQMNNRSLSKAIKVNDTEDESAVSLVVPVVATRASKVQAFDALGNVIVSNLTLAQIESGSTDAAASAIAAAASAGAASSSAGAALASQNAAAASAASANYRYCGTAGGTANALTLTPGAPLASYSGALLEFNIASANTTEAMTVNASTLGNRNLKVNLNGTKRNPAIGMFQPGMPVFASDDGSGTDLIVLNAPWDNQATDVAAAATVALASATGNFANLTGSGGPVTAITGLTKGRRMLLRHTASHTLTHSATLFLLNGANNMSTLPGDISEWITDGTNVYMTRYLRANGQPHGDVNLVNSFLQRDAVSPYLCFANKFRNGAFSVYNRGASGTASVGSTFCADGWILEVAGASITWDKQNQVTSTLDTLRLVGNTGNTGIILRQRIEGDLSAALRDTISGSKQVTVQIKLSNFTGASITPLLTVTMANGFNDFSAVTNLISGVSMQAAPDSATTTLCYTFTANNALVGNGIEVKFDLGAMNSNAKAIRVSEADIRVTPGVPSGLNSSPPAPEIRPVWLENIQCERWLPTYVGANNYPIGAGVCISTTHARFYWDFKTKCKGNPTGLTASAASTFYIYNNAAAGIVCTAISMIAAGLNGMVIDVTVASGLVQGDATIAFGNGAGGSLLATGVEL